MSKRELGRSGASSGRALNRGFAVGGKGARPAPPGGVPYKATRCHGKKEGGDRCKARPVKGTELCIGHSRSKDAN